MRLKDKVAVVTGGGRGIGRATARLFAEHGAHVGIAEIEAELCEKVEGDLGGRVFARPTDVTKAQEVERFFAHVREHFGKLDILVCNAGRPFALTSTTATEAEWDECLNLNLRSAWYCAREAHPLMREVEGGSIVTIASVQGYRSSRRSFPYSAAKGGLLGLTRNLAVEYAPENIRVNAVIPGQIQSVRTEPYFQSFEDPEEARHRVLRSFPLRRLGTPEDVAQAVLFLASDDASWVTGSQLVVDGGREAAKLDLSDLKY